MSRQPFPRRDVERLVDDLEKQGCKIKGTKAGYLVGFPNGESMTVHLTSSDTRAIRNTRARVEKNGCTWPL